MVTKPADSDQIARAEKMWREMSTAECLEIGMYEFAVKFAASERQAVIEECCRAVCAACEEGRDELVFSGGSWCHIVEGVNGTPTKLVDCDAAAIRSME